MAEHSFSDDDFTEGFATIDAASTVLEAILNADLNDDSRDPDADQDDLEEGEPIPPDSPTKL